MICQLQSSPLSGAVLVLGLAVSSASGQTPFAAEINTAYGPLGVTANLPAGWVEGGVALASNHGITLVLPEDGWRAVHLGIGQWAHERLGHRQSSVRGFRPGGAPIESRRVALGGQPATSYLGLTPAGGLIASVPERETMVAGPQMLVHFDGCYGERPDPVLLTVISGGAPFAELSDDPHLAALFAEFVIELPPGAQPCPADLAARLNAVPAPDTDAGWARRERFGLSFWLPEDFEVVEDYPSGFFAMHPDHVDPDGTGMFGVQMSRESSRDHWRQGMPGSASLTALPPRELGALGLFEATTAIFQEDGYNIEGTVIVARAPDADGLYLSIGIAAVRPEGQKPWLGLQDLHDSILARLGRP